VKWLWFRYRSIDLVEHGFETDGYDNGYVFGLKFLLFRDIDP